MHIKAKLINTSWHKDYLHLPPKKYKTINEAVEGIRELLDSETSEKTKEIIITIQYPHSKQ